MRIQSTLLLAAAPMAAAMVFTAAPAYAQEGCGGENSDNDDYNIACGTTATTIGGSANIAIGGRATANGGNMTEGSDRREPGGNTAIGQYTNASGAGGMNTALGSGYIGLGGAYAVGDNASNIALGTGNNASGNNSYNIAIGYKASATGDGQSRIAIGDEAAATNSSTMAVGADARASGQASVALGYGTRATHTASVAVGNGSSTNQDNSVSFGNSALKRKLVFVADGTIASGSSEAVTGGQLYTTNQRIAELEGGTGDALAVAQAAQQDADTALAQNVVQNGRLNAIETRNGVQDNRLDAIEAHNGIQDGRLDAVEAVNTAQTERLDGIDATNTVQDGQIATAQATANTAIQRNTALGQSTAAALGGGSAYNPATGAVSAPGYTIDGTVYNNVGAAFAAVDGRLGAIDTRIDILSASTDRRFRHATGGIAAAMALGGTMIVPDSDVSMSFNLATYRGEQGFAGSVVVRAAPRVYVSGGFAGSTVRGSTGGRVGVAFGF